MSTEHPQEPTTAPHAPPEPTVKGKGGRVVKRRQGRLHPLMRKITGRAHIQQHDHPHKPVIVQGPRTRPAGSGSGSTPSGLPQSGYFGPNPPNTTNHWLAGFGHAITATPAMEAVAQDFRSLGYYSQRQAKSNAARIGNIKSTV